MGIFAPDTAPSDTPGFSSDLGSDSGSIQDNNVIDRDLQDFVMLESEKATINAQILEFSDFCWDKCLTDKPGSKLSGKTETCLSNCVNRFIDTSVFLVNRFTASMKKSTVNF